MACARPWSLMLFAGILAADGEEREKKPRHHRGPRSASLRTIPLATPAGIGQLSRGNASWILLKLDTSPLPLQRTGEGEQLSEVEVKPQREPPPNDRPLQSAGEGRGEVPRVVRKVGRSRGSDHLSPTLSSRLEREKEKKTASPGQAQAAK